MKKLKNLLLGILFFCTASLFMLQVFSPYKKHEGLNYKHIRASVIVDAPIDSVYSYLGKSDRVGEWSMFMSHAKILNGDSFEDGRAGSKRRCYDSKDEQGRTWQESVVEETPGKRRLVALSSMTNFPISEQNLHTEQLFSDAGHDRTKVSLTLFYKDHEPGFFDNFRMNLAAWRIQYVFDKDLKKVKAKLEGNKGKN